MSAMETPDHGVLQAELTRAKFMVLNPPQDLQALSELRKRIAGLYSAFAWDANSRLQAQALLRRAERLLAAAAIEALEKGEVTGIKSQRREGVPSLLDYMNESDWINGRIRRLGQASEEQFEQALELCVAGGSAAISKVLSLLPAPPRSKAAVVGKTYPPPVQRGPVIEKMAAQGHSASSIGRELGITTEYVRELARRHNITIRAEHLLRHRARTIDAEQVIETTINSLEDLASGLAIIDNMNINPGLAKLLAKNLNEALKPFGKLQRQLMEEN